MFLAGAHGIDVDVVGGVGGADDASGDVRVDVVGVGVGWGWRGLPHCQAGAH